MKKVVYFLLVFLIVFSLSNSNGEFFAEAYEVIDDENAYCHISRDFEANYHIEINTNVNHQDDIQALCIVQLANRQVGSTTLRTVFNFKTVETYVRLTRLNGDIEEDRDEHTNTKLCNSEVVLGRYQYACATQHDAEATIDTVNSQNVTAADVSVHYYG